jgi:magnesium-transporting ATPase (P-type)
MLFYGTFACGGEGLGVATKTGASTVIGQLARVATTHNFQRSTLSYEIAAFVIRASSGAILCSIAFLSYGLATGMPVLLAVIFGIGIITAFCSTGSTDNGDNLAHNRCKEAVKMQCSRERPSGNRFC